MQGSRSLPGSGHVFMSFAGAATVSKTRDHLAPTVARGPVSGGSARRAPHTVSVNGVEHWNPLFSRSMVSAIPAPARLVP